MANIITRIKNFLWGKHRTWVAIAMSIFFISITLFVLFQPALAESNSNLVTNQIGHYCDFNNGFVEGQLDFNSISFNDSISYLGLCIPLYSKLNTSSIFGNNIRADIYNLITDNPGITFGAITRKLKLKPGTASHHIRILEREGYINSKKIGKFRRYYEMGIKTSDHNQIQDQIIQQVQDHPGISQAQIAKELDLSRQLVNYHIKDLISSQVILTEKIGNKSNCFITVQEII